MNTKIVTKVFASILAFILSFAHVALLGSYMDRVYAASENLESQTTEVKKAAIEFDAYFEENGKNVHSKTMDIAKEGETLKLSFKVEDGYLASGKIKIENANFKLQETDEDSDLIQSISSENNEIVLNSLGKDESVILSIPVRINTDSSFDVKNLSKVASVNLEGVYVNNKGKEVKIEKTIEIETSLDGTADSSLNERLTKYVPFEVNGKRGVILQTLIESNLVDNKLPVKSNELEIEIPTINDIKPNTIALSAKSLKATNGTDVKVFGKSDYKIEDGKVKLTLNNNNEILSWEKDAKDEIIFSCVYGEEASDFSGKIKLNVKSNISYYGKEIKSVQNDFSDEVEVDGKVGEIITLEVNTSEDLLYKGYMMSNSGKNTEFSDVMSLDIGYHELMDKITFKDEIKYVDKNGNEFPSNAIYTYSKISNENLTQILGEDGYINIYNSKGELITTLNKDNLEYKYEGNISALTFETNKPVQEGILKIENGRSIMPLEYSEVQEESFENIRINFATNIVKDDAVIISANQIKDVALGNPTSKARLELSNTNISTVLPNEGVELRVTLDTNDMSTMLYKNPEVNITFPSYISNIKVENVKLVYEKELKIESAKMYRNENGNAEINIKLNGEQTKYNEEYHADGAMLIMNADIVADALTPTKTENIHLNVKNENLNEVAENDTQVKFVAPAGIALASKISGYSDSEDNMMSISGNEGIANLKSNSSARQATMEIIAINNYENDCEDIVILGRIPFEGNKGISNNNELGSTFDTKMVSEIVSENGLTPEDMTVYYSSNKEATKDLNNNENNWKINIEEVENVYSYMIVLNNYKFKTGDILKFNYEIEIPENLEKNEISYGIFGVYYKKVENQEDGIMTVSNLPASMTQGTPLGIATETGADLEVTLTSNPESSQDIEEFSDVIYTAKITNKSNIAANNVKLRIYLPENGLYINNKGEIISNLNNSYVDIDVGNIDATSEKEVEFTLRAGAYIKASEDYQVDFSKTLEETKAKIDNQEGLKEEEKEELKKKATEELTKLIEESGTPNKLIAKVEAVVQNEGAEDTFKATNIIHNIKETDNKLVMTATTASQASDAGMIAEYQLSVRKTKSDALKNVVITCVIPEGLTFEDTINNYEYNANTRTVTWKFEEMTGSISLTLHCKIDKLPDGVYKKDLPIKFVGTIDGQEEKFESNTIEFASYAEGYQISQTSSISSSKLYAEQQITYNIIVTNISEISAKCEITDYLPKELRFIKYYYTRNNEQINGTTTSGNDVKIPLTLDKGETVIIHVVAIAEKIDETSVEISNKAVLNSSEVTNLAANEIKHTLYGKTSDGNEGDGDKDQQNPNEVYGVSGLVWEDANKNGIREDNEKLLSDIKVYLLESKANKIVSETTSNKNGAYSFSNVQSGSYLVAFEYNTSLYEVTGYQVDNGDEFLNSDAIKMDINIKGDKKTLAVTDTINLNSNMYNIDLGLINSPKFDLSLTKGISLVQVSNDQGTKNYTFNGEDAKIEIPEKYLKSSVVAITYVIKVKNEGVVPGYVNRVTDYKARDLTFSSSLNPEWYEDSNGDLYNNSLTGRVINPGETVELSLILTKTITEENIGVSNNTAEITESYNDLGTTDIDSTPGNRNTSEDDLGACDIIIAVQTGGILFYGGIVLLVLMIFAFGAYFINKKILRKF